MKKNNYMISITSLLLIFLCVNPALSSDLLLSCDYSSTWYPKTGKQEATSGTTSLSLTVSQENKITIKQSGVGTLYYGNADANEFSAMTGEFPLDENVNMRRHIHINRTSGDLEEIVVIGDGELVHFGKCFLTKQKF